MGASGSNEHRQNAETPSCGLTSQHPRTTNRRTNPMPLLTKRLSDPVKRSDGFRLVITQIKPRTGPKGKEKWDQWYPELGPSKELQAAFYGAGAMSISWDEFRTRYLREMKAQEELIHGLAELVAEGKTITLV